MKYTLLQALFLTICACFAGGQPQANAASYKFDLTSFIDSHLAGPLETPIDLGTQFQQVDSATLHLSGTFTPALVTPLTIPENAGPIVSNDTFNLAIRLGDEGTSFIDKNVAAYQELHGYSGSVSFTLPLLGIVPDPSSLPVLFPEANGTPDFSFLLDGRFAIAAVGLDILAGIYQELQPPQFEVSSFVLQTEGSAVPEPAAALLAAASCVALLCCRLRGIGTATRG